MDLCHRNYSPIRLFGCSKKQNRKFISARELVIAQNSFQRSLLPDDWAYFKKKIIRSSGSAGCIYFRAKLQALERP
jgi:hypothetical protein